MIKIIVLTMFSAFILLLASCEEKTVVKKQNIDSLDLALAPDQVSNDVEVIFADSSFTKAILKADRAEVYSDKAETILEGSLVVEFMSKSTGKRVSVLTANSAIIDNKTNNMLAKGDVVVVSDSTDTKLQTQVLEWNDETRKIYSTEFVKITTPRERIEGYGFESDPHLDNYKIFKVSGVQR
ncbi:MAG: LPS export ABC transporter periplasmic protein LptC [Bacteroidota bacterium]